MESILKILSPATAPYALIACITDAVTCNGQLMTDRERLDKILAALREFDAMFPCEPITSMLASYDERRKHEKGNL